MRKFIAIIDGFNAKIGKIICFILLFTLFCVGYEVVSRYAFVKPTIWANELIIYSCALLYILGAAWTMQVGRHVKVDLLYKGMSPRGQRLLDIITFPFFALYMVLLIWVGFRFALESITIQETSGTPWNPPIYPIKITFVFGALMLILQGLAKFFRDIYFVFTGEEL